VPGNLVSATVASIHTSGLVLTFMGFFEATVDLSHIGVRPEDIESKFKLGQNLKARITFCSLNTTPKKIGASLLPNIVELTQDNTPLEDRFPVGTIFEKVTVKRVDTKNGLDVDIDGLEKVKGFVHVSCLGHLIQQISKQRIKFVNALSCFRFLVLQTIMSPPCLPLLATTS
jgi:rRNA biogenesis protein RRP5